MDAHIDKFINSQVYKCIRLRKTMPHRTSRIPRGTGTMCIYAKVGCSIYKQQLKLFYQQFIRTKPVVSPGRGNHHGTIYIYIYISIHIHIYIYMYRKTTH